VARVDPERFWDEKARENALYFVDTRLDYDDPDTEWFWAGGDEALDKMLDLVGLTIRSDETVVDIGCGVGRMTRALAGRATHVYGIDVSREMLVRAREHNPDLKNVEWLHGDGHGLGVLEDRSVDGCFSHVVFQHLPDPAITLNYVREMGRVLSVGGWALFQVSSDPSVHSHLLSLRSRVKARLGFSNDGRHDPAWAGSAVEVGALRKAMADGGLDVERLLLAGSQYTTVLGRKHG
jgi:SAM-dependent methyltransferase